MILIKVGIMLRFEMFYMMVHKKFWTFIWSHASENSFQKDDFVMLTSRAKLYPPNLAHQETLNVFCATKVMDFQISWAWKLGTSNWDALPYKPSNFVDMATKYCEHT